MATLDREQMRNAAIIYRVGKQMGMSVRDIQIALITAMQESSLRNLDYGDKDSLGLFQQRPSQGWGTPEQVTDPIYASRKFYTELKKLGDRRYDMSMTEAAQAVQRSAYPDAYAKHIPLIRDIWPRLGKGGAGSAAGAAGPTTIQQKANREFVFGDDDQDMDVELDPMGVLKAQYSPVLAAPELIGGTTPVDMSDWMTFLTPEMNVKMQDIATSGGMGYQKGLDGWRKAIVETAQDYIGTPYKWGGASPEGFDCSGLLQYVYAKVGISLPRVSYQQANYGQRVGIGALRPGDLVAWDNSSRNNGADHIAIYIGNGRIIESPRPGLSVRTRKLRSDEGAWGVRISR